MIEGQRMVGRSGLADCSENYASALIASTSKKTLAIETYKDKKIVAHMLIFCTRM